jgi:hypothetical protein
MRVSAIAFKVHVSAAVEQRPDDVFAYHAVGDTEPVRDGRGIKALNLIHDERLAALWRHALNQSSKVAKCLFAGKLPFRCAILCQFGEELATGNFVEVLSSSAPIDGDVGGGLEEKSPQIADGARLIQA